jgi:hypothetical protein
MPDWPGAEAGAAPTWHGRLEAAAMVRGTHLGSKSH